MSVRTLLVFLSALAPAAAAAASPAPPARPVAPPAILNLANAVVTASNTDDASLLSKLYTSDAIVVDEVPPFAWRGHGAGAAWWRAVDAFTQQKHEHIKLIDVRVSEFRSSGTDAYLVQPMTIVEMGAGAPGNESGTFTYTFHYNGGAWLISSQVWTTKP